MTQWRQFVSFYIEVARKWIYIFKFLILYEYFSRAFFFEKMLCYELSWLLFRPEVSEKTGNETESRNLFNSVWNYYLSKYIILNTIYNLTDRSNPFSNWNDSIPLTMKIFDISSLTVTNTSTFPWYAAYHMHKNWNIRNSRSCMDIF